MSEIYLNNKNLKAVGVQIEWTEEQILEYKKCSEDIVYFAKTYCKVVHIDRGLVNFNLYDYQEEMIDVFKNNRFSIVRIGRQSGKTVTAAVFLLHSILFIPQYSVAILANKERQANEILSRIKLMYEYLPKWLQQGVLEWNKGNIELENGSKILASATSSSATRGGSFSCVVGGTKVTIFDDYGRIFIIDIEKANSSKFKYNEHHNHWGKHLYYTVYRITNLVNGKQYIGYHHTNKLNDGYMGSGKLIKKAIEKYGIENFYKEYLAIFDNQKEAEDLEAELVNEEWVFRDDTYNLSLGGNICALPGKLNPFYGKHHPPELIERIAAKSRGRNYSLEDDLIIDGVRYNSWKVAREKLNFDAAQFRTIMLKEGNGYVDPKRQKKLIKFVENQKIRKEQNKIYLSMLKTGVHLGPMKEETKQKISKALSGVPHSEEWVNKINKNPEKIRKMAVTHTGMKRSEESKNKMSKARKEAIKRNGGAFNKGTIVIHNKQLNLVKTISKTEIIPEGWERGSGPRHLAEQRNKLKKENRLGSSINT